MFLPGKKEAGTHLVAVLGTDLLAGEPGEGRVVVERAEAIAEVALLNRRVRQAGGEGGPYTTV